MDGKKRHLFNKINKLLNLFPVVVIFGVRQCGKSTLARQIRPDWQYFDLENHQDFSLINDDSSLFFANNPNHLIIDEAQKSPVLFETLRGVIDQNRESKGRFILSGSASFDLIKNVSESLAGRVATVELQPFKCSEYLEKDLSPFFEIFNQKISIENIDSLKKLECRIETNVMTDFFLKGGYPEPILHHDPEFHSLWMQNYFDQYINRDVRSLFPKLDLIKYRRVLQMLSQLNGTIVNKAEVAKSIEANQNSVKDYIDIIAGTYFWRNLPAYITSKIKTTQKLPKGHFVDSGLALYLQNILNKQDLQRSPYLGRFFEAFAAEEVIRGIHMSQAVNVQVSHLRTKAGGEIDLIVEGSFGLLPIEIKYGSSTSKSKLKFLHSFIELHNLPYGVLINNSNRVQMITDKIIQIPIGAI
ncbi:hypothetical protein BVY03_01730 [bacterium K02(2017)]|nr:hypothetical protein BVY03_01730 [bacterium K02(2017)]